MAILLLLFGIGIVIYIICASRRAALQKEKAQTAQREKELQDQKKLQMEKQREAELKLQEESKQAAERRRIAEEESRKKREEKFAAYDKMVSAIQEYPAVISDTKASKKAISFINNLTFSSITKRTDMSKLGDFVALDTETTGLKCVSDEIIDIAAIRFRNFQPVAKFSMLLASGKPIPPDVSSVNHITDEMVAGCPCFQQVAASLVEFIGDDNIVGHNLPFDLKFIVHYGADVTVRSRKYYDTLAISQKTVKRAKQKWDKELEEYVEDEDSDGISNYKLETLCSYFGILNMSAHRAEGDALATGMLFHKLAEIRIG